MAEGDTLKRAELRLKPILLNQKVLSLWFKRLKGYRPRTGQTITNVEAVGKNLLLEFDQKITLRSHLGMYGSWKAFPEKTLEIRSVMYKPKTSAVLVTSAGSVVCSMPQILETFPTASRPQALARLGPDLTSDTIDFHAVTAAALAKPQVMLCELLLDQHVACGVGNIYKSEALFLSTLHPFQLVKETSEQQLHDLFMKASAMLRKNSLSGNQTRKTSPVGQYYVYERYRLPCRRCSTPIKRSYRGEYKRSTYWCPQCQK